MNNLIGAYQNGNYKVSIYEDGTKIRENDLNNLTPSFAESIDITITNKCDGLCKFCYMNCTPESPHAELLLNREKLWGSLHPYTELALNVNDLTHPQLDQFLLLLKEKKVIPNITINMRHLKSNYNKIKELIDNKLIYGIGISYDRNSFDDEMLDMIKNISNSVIHTIAGILEIKDIMKLVDNDLKLLILGYKKKGRGKSYYNKIIEFNIEMLHFVIKFIIPKFKVISFDNLALEQLNIKSLVPEEKWNEIYMGDEGQYTFFIDLVNNQFAISSLEEEMYDMNDMNVDEMFSYIQNKRKIR